MSNEHLIDTGELLPAGNLKLNRVHVWTMTVPESIFDLIKELPRMTEQLEEVSARMEEVSARMEVARIESAIPNMRRRWMRRI